MRRRRTPTMATIGLAVILVIVGILGTFASVVPNGIAVIAYIAAGIVMLLGIFVRGL
jgi:fatty acid desaturase